MAKAQKKTARRKTARHTPGKRKPAPEKVAGSKTAAVAWRARLERVVEESGLLQAGERVGIAVSGGADSVAMLLLMAGLQPKLGLSLTVLHFNHQLRGRASGADEKFVVKLASKLGLPVHCGGNDVQAFARREKTNLEDAARRARYDFFKEAARSLRLNKIAVAHTADDQAETVLAHILRGTGLSGLAGIHPLMQNVARPLLGVRREELRVFLRQEKQSWREDASNQDLSKLRARTRKKLIPYLEKTFQARVVEHLCALAGHAREDNALIERLVESRLTAYSKKSAEGTSIAIADLLGIAPRAEKLARENDAEQALSRRLVRGIIAEMKPRVGQVSGRHIAQVLELARCGRPGAALTLPGGVEVRRLRNELLFCERGSSGAACEYEYKIESLKEPCRLAVPELRCEFRFTMIDWPGNRVETSISGDVLDARQLQFPLWLRNWRAGDRFQPAGHASEQKLKRLLNQKGIDRWKRKGWPVIVSNGILVWARGFGASAEFAPGRGSGRAVAIVEQQL
jgi:tRNA(Ile)-lysidine synthase